MAARIGVVTGGGTGVGAAITTALAADGWTVVVAGRHAESLDAVVAANPAGSVHAVPCDITDPDSVTALFATVVERFERLDLLVNNAGRSSWARTVDELGIDEWRDVVDVNVTGTFLCTREAFRIMRYQTPQGGRIINNGSISAHAPRPFSIAYTATKHAVTGMTKSTALDGRPFGIACGQIDIGNAATDMTQAMSGGVPQADGSLKAEPTMNVAEVGDAVVYMAGLPLTSNVASITVMATAMPFVGRG
jgi:NAD(P)-dependent dehydrogenase (short-subunit alcohol dehydrogenase family)